MVNVLKIIFLFISYLPLKFLYFFYDILYYFKIKKFKEFKGWGIHLFVGKFGYGKSSAMVIKAYKLAKKYPQLTILTNMTLVNFPKHTRVLKLNTAQDIVNAPDNCLVLIDEIGTIFNSRDFSSGSCAVPKPLYQHLSQCRHRHMMIYGTVQRYNLLDKQIRDISADVTVCRMDKVYPFGRFISLRTYDTDEYEMYMVNRLYRPRLDFYSVFAQTEHRRQLYDTKEMVNGFLDKEFLSDKEIMENRGEYPSIFGDYKSIKKANRRKHL